MHKNVNLYFTDAFVRSAIIKPPDIGESSLHVLAPIHSHTATEMAAVVTGVLIQADTLYAAMARFIGLDDAVTITFHLKMFSFGHDKILIW